MIWQGLKLKNGEGGGKARFSGGIREVCEVLDYLAFLAWAPNPHSDPKFLKTLSTGGRFKVV